MDIQSTKIDNLPRTEVTSKRATLSKLLKDFDRIKINIQALVNESSLVKVTNEKGETDSFKRVVNTSSSVKLDSSNNTDKNTNNEYDNQNITKNSLSKNNNSLQQQQQIVLKPLLTGKEVDEAIIEERERDIKKMNHDLLLVNEMFK